MFNHIFGWTLISGVGIPPILALGQLKPILSLFMAIPLLLSAFLISARGLKKVKRFLPKNEDHFFIPDNYMMIPIEISPAVFFVYQYQQSPNANALVATIMDLIRMEIISLKEVKKEEDDGTYLFSLETAELDKLRSHEAVLVDWLFPNGSKQISLEVINMRLKTQKEEDLTAFLDFFKSWQEKVIQEARIYTENQYDEKNVVAVKTATKQQVLLLFLIGLSLFLFGIFRNYLFIATSMLTLVLVVRHFLAVNKYFPVLTFSGRVERAKWSAFQSAISRIETFNMSEVASISEWDRIMTYSMPVNQGFSILKNLKIQFSQTALDQMPLGKIFFKRGVLCQSNESIGIYLYQHLERNFANMYSRAATNRGFGESNTVDSKKKVTKNIEFDSRF